MAFGLVLVQQHQRMILFRLGKFIKINGSGLYFLMPFLYKGRIINLREQSLNLIPPDADGYANRAVAYTILGRDELAQRDVRQALILGFDRTLLEEIIQHVSKVCNGYHQEE